MCHHGQLKKDDVEELENKPKPTNCTHIYHVRKMTLKKDIWLLDTSNVFPSEVDPSNWRTESVSV